jgi:hypothetical protein
MEDPAWVTPEDEAWGEGTTHLKQNLESKYDYSLDLAQEARLLKFRNKGGHYLSGLHFPWIQTPDLSAMLMLH